MDINELLDAYVFAFPGGPQPGAARQKIIDYVTGLEQENARLREAARWIKTPEDPPNFDEWHLVAFQGAYYWVKNPPIIEHQEVG